MKKCILIFFISVLTCFGGLYAQTILGDVNASGDITITDALMVAQYYVGLEPAVFVSSAADVDCSGDIAILDALFIAQYYVNLLSEFPCTTIPVDGTQITLQSNSISVDGPGAFANGNTVTITSAGLFAVSGSISDGQIIVDTMDEDKVEITLNSVSITCLYSAPINIKNGEVKLYIEGYNSITDGTSYIYDDVDDEEPNAAIFSKDDLTIKGAGYLTINANFKDGINCNDDLKISSGTIDVTAVDDGLVGNESIEVNGGTITVNSQGDCLRVTEEEDTDKGDIQIDGGTLHLTTTDDDGMSAFRLVEINDGTITISAASQGIKSDNEVVINGGVTEVTRCNEGIEAKNINIIDGSFIGYATDDTLNSTMGRRTEANDGSQIIISGGTHYLNASNGDSIDSNGSFTMTGGIVAACGPTSGANVAIDVNASTTVSGGEFIATSSNSRMNEYPNGSSPQYSMAIMFSSSHSGNSIICIRDGGGNELIKYRAQRTFYSLIYSSPQLTYGSTYTVSAGGTVSGGTELNNIISGGTYNGGSTLETITINSSPTTVSGNFGSGGPGGF
jgi:hypothetical protein